jgi:adenine phosphoribosyltransferase
LSTGFVPIRKRGKLPGVTVSMAYDLEYGTDQMEIHAVAFIRGTRIVLVDDLIATGGTSIAAIKLLQGLKAIVVAACFVIDLPEFGRRQKIENLGVPTSTLVSFV